MARRVRVPSATSAEVEFLADRRCCVCLREGTQLHHLDGTPAHNRPHNLVLLCLQHHDEATKTGGLTRKLSRATIVRYRDHHYLQVRKARAFTQRNHRKARSEAPFETALDALYVFEIRHLHSRLTGDWQTATDVLAEALRLGFLWSPRVRVEAAELPHTLSISAYSGMPLRVAEQASLLSEECLPFWLRLKTKDPPDVRTESDVLQLVADTGFGMARAGLDQLANIKIVETGARLMASCIEIADAFDGPLRAHFQESMEMLAGLAEAERTVLGDNAAQWIRFRGRAALDKLAWAAPDYPRAVGDLVFR